MNLSLFQILPAREVMHSCVFAVVLCIPISGVHIVLRGVQCRARWS